MGGRLMHRGGTYDVVNEGYDGLVRKPRSKSEEITVPGRALLARWRRRT